MSDLETEATAPDGTTTFEHFGRSWTVPVRRQHSHIRRLKQITRAEGGVNADDVAEVFLSPEDYEALAELNVYEDQLSEFSDEIARAMGVGDKGNS